MVVNKRYLALVLPSFRLERCGYGPEDLAALLDEQKNALRLVALTPACTREGLRLGMTASEARALVPEVDLELLDHDGERRDRAALLRALVTLSDQVYPLWDQAAILDISRTSRAFHGEAGLLRSARALIDDLGHLARLAIASDPTAAAALALAHPGDHIYTTEQTPGALAPLSLELLQPSSRLLEGLRAVGITTIGELAQLDPASVAARYGDEGHGLHRVATGYAQARAEAIWNAPDDEPLVVRTPMAAATSTLQLHFVLPGLLTELSGMLAARNLAVVQLRVLLRLERGRPAVLPVRTGRPSRSPDVLERLIRLRLERITLEAPIEEIAIEVVETSEEHGWQPGLTDRREATEPLPDLLARLSDTLGDQALFSATLADAWRPEVAWKAEPFQPNRPPPRKPRVHPHDEDPVLVQERWERALQAPRPSQLLDPPQQIQVKVVGGRPRALHDPKHGWLGIERLLGPERLQGEWWAPGDAWERSYWVVQVQQSAQWIYQTHGRWYRHGWFD